VNSGKWSGTGRIRSASKYVCYLLPDLWSLVSDLWSL